MWSAGCRQKQCQRRKSRCLYDPRQSTRSSSFFTRLCVGSRTTRLRPHSVQCIHQLEPYASLVAASMLSGKPHRGQSTAVPTLITASRMRATSSFENGGAVFLAPPSLTMPVPLGAQHNQSSNPCDLLQIARRRAVALHARGQPPTTESCRMVQWHLSLCLNHSGPNLLCFRRHLLLLSHRHRTPLLSLGLRNPLVGFGLIRL